MSAVSQEGMLVVFPSPLENVPYTLAEVAVAGTPLLTFDVGGASELIDPKTHEDLFCGLPSVRAPQHPVSVPRHRVTLQTDSPGQETHWRQETWIMAVS
jgi:hypothetical protein